MPLVWASMVLPAGRVCACCLPFSRMENTVSKTKEKSRKEPTLSSAPASEKEKAHPAQNTSAEVIAFTGRKGNGNGGYQYPDINLLKRPKEKIGLSISEKELNETARALEGVLEEFGVHGEIVKIRPGPVVTLFELEPAPGTKTSRVIRPPLPTILPVPCLPFPSV